MPSRSAARSASCSARGEAGAGNMADAYARSTASLGVCVTSTGPAAGNIAGSMVEALTAGAPLLHITGQIETPYLDKGLSYIHEAPDQLTMLKAVSKAAFRVRSVENGARHAQAGGAGRAHRADRPGQRGDPDRHPIGARPRCRRISRRCPSSRRALDAPRLDALGRRSSPPPSGRCCGSAAARAVPARRSSACRRWASAS